MQLRALVINDKAKQRIQEVIEYAQLHRLDLKFIEKLAAGKAPVPGDDPNRVVKIPDGYRAVFTIEAHPLRDGTGVVWFRHISVSVNSPGKLPNEVAVQFIANEFGFPNIRQGCMIDVERDEKNQPLAVNVLTPIGESKTP